MTGPDRSLARRRARLTLAGRRIAVTRPDAGELGELLTTAGATVVHVPLIEIADPADGGAALRQALGRLDSFDWLVVTSANGARRAGPAAADQPALRLAAVGPATAAALATAAGRPVDLVPALAQAEGLLAELPATPAARVLLAQADRARSVLADGLAAAGHTVEAVTAYRTAVRTPTFEEVVRLHAVDAVVLASGSAAEGWAATDPPVGVVVVALGPVTAAAARARGVRVDHVADAPDAASVTDLLSRVLR